MAALTREMLLGIDPDQAIAEIVETLRAQVGALHRHGLVLGVSGGVDSALMAARLGVPTVTEDVTAAVEGLGCHVRPLPERT
ncbi:MAG: hypothetical protein U0359_07345 [Byssovorax sp.]